MPAYYLGNPATLGMVKLPDTYAVPAPLDRGIQTVALASGGTTSIQRTRTRRVFPLEWPYLTADETGTIAEFYVGAHAPGPYVLVDPTWANLLSVDLSTAGQVRKSSLGFAPSIAASVAYLPPPLPSTVLPALLGSGAQTWIVTSAAQSLQVGASVFNTADTLTVPPYIAAEAYTFSFTAWMTAGTRTVTPSFIIAATSGSLGSASSGGAVALTTTPVVVSMTMAAGTFAASTAYVMPSIAVSAGTAQLINIAGLSVTLDGSTTWRLGQGCPRVVLAGQMGYTGALPARSVALTLTEA